MEIGKSGKRAVWDPRREADEQFLIFPGNGYIFPWIYELCIYGYADQPQDLPCAVWYDQNIMVS